MATSPPVALDDPGREFSEARLLVFHLLPRAGERAHQIRGANCVQSTLNGTVTQVLSAASGLQRGKSLLAVDAVNSPVTGLYQI